MIAVILENTMGIMNFAKRRGLSLAVAAALVTAAGAAPRIAYAQHHGGGGGISTGAAVGLGLGAFALGSAAGAGAYGYPYGYGYGITRRRPTIHPHRPIMHRGVAGIRITGATTPAESGIFGEAEPRWRRRGSF